MRIVVRILVVFIVLVALGCAAVSQRKSSAGSSNETTNDQRIFNCKAEIGSFRVISGSNDTIRLQLPSNPSQIKGSERVEGSSACAYSIWTFQSGTKGYTVSELGCYPDDNQPPAGAKGRLEISTNGASANSYWCY